MHGCCCKGGEIEVFRNRTDQPWCTIRGNFESGGFACSSKMRDLVITCLWVSLANLVLRSSADILCHNFTQRRIENTGINFEDSRRQNASVTVVLSKHAKSLEECKNACCGQILNKCNIITYNRDGIKSNCHLFYCEPSELCAFMDSPGMDLWILNSPNELSHPQDPGGQNGNASKNVSMTARPDNVNTTVSLNDILKSIMEDQKTTKLPTVVPRKGVRLPSPNDTVAEEKSSTKSSVKPRKGVGFPVDLNETLRNSSLDPDVLTSNAATELPFSSDRENITMQASLMSSSDQATSETTRSSTQDVTKTTVDSSTSTTRNVGHTISSPSFPSKTSESAVVHVTPNTSLGITLSTSPKSDVSYATEFRLNGSTINSPGSVVTSSSNSPSSTDDELSGTTAKSSYGDKTDATAASDAEIISNNTTKVLSTVTIPTVNVTKAADSELTASKSESPSASARDTTEELLLEEEEEDESALESKSTARIHLVIALTLGLVILIAVLLVTARGMFDRWQRRHYRRMDYLIDGMYHN